jgi:hypothetical protein
MKKLLLLILISTIGCNQNEKNITQSQNTITSIKLHQELPKIVHIDLGVVGNSTGDLMAFDSVLSNDKGMTGMLSGYITTIDIPNETETFEDRMVHMVFEFGGANTIVVGGKSVYPKILGAEFTKLKPQIRAVVGGTGEYMGARGQLTSTRNEDGTYEHLIELMK